MEKEQRIGTSQDTDNAERSQIRKILRIQLRAVHQHFIHVVLFRARKDHDRALHVSNIDFVDFPIAMRLIDYLVSQGSVVFNKDDDLEQTAFPVPGFLDHEIIQAEVTLEQEFSQALGEALSETSSISNPHLRMLLQTAKSPRSDYHAWLKTQSDQASRSDRLNPQIMTHDQVFANSLMAALISHIEQTLIHSFVHWHAGEKARADFSWELSGAAMMQATELTQALAIHGSCPMPVHSDDRHLRHQSTAPETLSDLASIADRTEAKKLAEACRNIADGFESEALSRTAEKCCQFYSIAATLEEGQALPNIPNPCRDFERSLNKYVFPQLGAKSA